MPQSYDGYFSKTDSEGTPAHFPLSALKNRLCLFTRMCDPAFKRSLRKVPLDTVVDAHRVLRPMFTSSSPGPSTNGDCLLVVEKRRSKILATPTSRAIPVPLSLMADTAENTRSFCSCAENQFRASAQHTPQIKRELSMTLFANHLGICLIESVSYTVPMIGVPHSNPLCISFLFHGDT